MPNKQMILSARSAVQKKQYILERVGLPIQLTTFIGRERELADVGRLLTVARLVTLTGTGGVGKTRLGLEVASQLQESFADGAWLVELASVSEPTLVARTVAAVLEAGEVPGQPVIDTLKTVLSRKRTLLIIDNCEHLIVACGELVDQLLRACAELKVLATSRERLGVEGEVAYRVPSLATPDASGPAGTDEVGASESVRLFVERARLVMPSFVLADANAAAVAQICQRLDGIPLALELAAARVRLLSPRQILARLDDSFRLLVSGSRSAPSRHRTLRATLDWSYGLLSAPERTLFGRLSVFSGGFSLEAAEAVGGGESLSDAEVLDVLSGLVDKSLVSAEVGEGGTTRYALLETLRQYATERLHDSGEVEAVRRRHAAFFLKFAEQNESLLVGGREQQALLDALERDHANLRAALQWALDQGESESGLRLAAALYRLWYLHGYLAEGRHWLARFITLSEGGRSSARARALRGAGLLAYAEGELAVARACTEQGLELAVLLEDERLTCAALNNLGIILIDQGDYAAARLRCEQGIVLARKLQDDGYLAVLLNNLGLVFSYEGHYRAAVPFFTESLAISEARGMTWSMAWSTGNLGNAAYHQGDLVTARARFSQSIVLGQQVGDKRVIAERLEELAWVACAEQAADTAARLFGAAEAMRETIGAPMPPANRPDYERSVALARAQLGEAGLAARWQEGRALSVEQAIAQALAPTAAGSDEPAPTVVRTIEPASLDRLSQREREVALLVADGLSNREIADTLVISVRTAEAHITSALGKLGLRSRAGLAVWAVERGLRAAHEHGLR